MTYSADIYFDVRLSSLDTRNLLDFNVANLKILFTIFYLSFFMSYFLAVAVLLLHYELLVLHSSFFECSPFLTKRY